MATGADPHLELTECMAAGYMYAPLAEAGADVNVAATSNTHFGCRFTADSTGIKRLSGCAMKRETTDMKGIMVQGGYYATAQSTASAPL